MGNHSGSSFSKSTSFVSNVYIVQCSKSENLPHVRYTRHPVFRHSETVWVSTRSEFNPVKSHRYWTFCFLGRAASWSIHVYDCVVLSLWYKTSVLIERHVDGWFFKFLINKDKTLKKFQTNLDLFTLSLLLRIKEDSPRRKFLEWCMAKDSLQYKY